MSGFSAEWLALREPADAAARSASVAASLCADATRPLTIVDLGAGTGANLRWLAPRLAGEQHWVAVDHDAALLDALGEIGAPPGVRVRPLLLDVARGLDAIPLGSANLVTASALLDLVSASWLQRLAERCAAGGADVLFALTYDGRIEWAPRDRSDETIRSLVNRHQRGDKGFGPALGPAAAATAPSIFRTLGYVVLTAASDWALQPRDAALQRALLEGFHAAALAIAPAERAALDDWQGRRNEWIERGESRLIVGHVDMAGRLR